MSHTLFKYIGVIALLLSPISFFFSPANAQTGTLYNGEQQLTSSFVHEVYQDATGFIWVATSNGLNRYDGYTFLTFGAEDGLTTEDVNCVTADKDRNVYAGTSNGIFVKVQGRFHPLKNATTGKEIQSFISTFYTLPDGTILFGTSGHGLWRVLDTDNAISIDNAYISFIKSISYGKGILWIGTEKRGVVAGRIADMASLMSKSSQVPGAPGSPNKNRPVFKPIKIYAPTSNFFYPVMTMGKDGTPIAGLYGGGLYRYDRAKQAFTLVPGTKDLPISSIRMRDDGNVFVGTNGYGVKVYNPTTGEIRQGTFLSPQLDMTRTKVVSILQDKSKNIWLGLFQKGVFMQRAHTAAFSAIGTHLGTANPIGESCVMAVAKQKDGTVWVSCDQDGLYKLRFDRLTNRYNLLKHFMPGGDFPTTILAMTEDQQGRLWIGSYTQGCGWIDTNTGQYHRASFSYGNAQAVFDIRCDYKGRIWIGTLGDGLKCYDPATDKVTEYKAVDGKPGLFNNYILQMETSADRKVLFIGTATGLSCIDATTGKWVKLLGKEALYTDQNVNALRYSPSTGLWVGTNKGLYNIRFKKSASGNTLSTSKEIHYDTHDGLPNIHVASIEIERGDAIWVSTSNGLFRLDPKTHQVNSFYTSDGTQGNEYSEGSSFCDFDTGIMYFGGTDGLTFFNPKNIKLQNTKFSIYISSIEVSGQRVKSFDKSGNYVVCEKAVSECDQFDFSHEDNNISINFSTLLYSGTEHTTFSYSIRSSLPGSPFSGENGEEWVTLPRGENTLTLSRLAPGDYHFKVKARNNGQESEIREFTITIHNPWYFTPLARVVYIFVIALLILWYLRNLKQKQKQALALQQHVHAEELNEQKLQFFMNLSHEIRTPMTLIISPIMKLIHEDEDAGRQATYNVIKRNAERILGLVNQILDIRKIDKGQMEMHMQETPIVPFIDDIMQMFSSQASSKNIKLNSDVNVDTNLSVWIDRSQFDKVIINLLSNAFKYVHTGGNVTVSCNTLHDRYLSITVFDDGDKISEENLPHIFERFYQANNSVNSSKAGTGIGLHLTQSIVELHHGTIAVQNVENGVQFTITIPLGNSHLRQSEMMPIEEKKAKEGESSNDGQETEVSEIKATNENDISSPSSNNKRPIIVVVEDDDDIRNYLMAELNSTYRVRTYADGAEALPAILRKVPHLIISDVMMPNMDGFTLCSRVKTNVNTNHVPFILLTAKTLDEDELQGLETGADLYVTKPFNMDVLRRNIANLLASRHLLENKFTGKEEAGAQLEDPEVVSFDEKLLSRIMAVINNNLNNSDLNIDMICREVGISRVHLHRKMKELTNQTPHDFIRNLRMKQAAHMLSHKGQSVTEVMYRCGFNSATSFSTMFKKMYGMSPREYMKEHAE